MAPILLIEDDDDIRADIAEVLREEGYDVVEARDGADALACVEATAAPPSLILLDLMMPRMDGWQFRAEQRGHAVLASVPTILLSGAGDLQRHVDELGATGALSKPFKLDKLLEAVAAHCPRSGPAR